MLRVVTAPAEIPLAIRIRQIWMLAIIIGFRTVLLEAPEPLHPGGYVHNGLLG
jgi:hypothetical protein